MTLEAAAGDDGPVTGLQAEGATTSPAMGPRAAPARGAAGNRVCWPFPATGQGHATILPFLTRNDVAIPVLGILDIGAMALDGQTKEYAPLLAAGRARAVGFEPVPEECDRLNAAFAGQGFSFLPYFIGDGTEQTFCLTNASMTSSLYEPNAELLALFSNLSELTTPVSRSRVRTTRLDDVAEIDFRVDYVKVDIQGAELQAFRHGERCLADTTVIHSEVEWVGMYRDQPLFAEVESELRRQGFVVHRILGFGSRAFRPFVLNNNPNTGPQHLWSDVVFVRDFCRLDRLSDRQLVAYAIIVAELYQAPDLAAHVLREYGHRIGRPMADAWQNWVIGRE